MALQIAFCRLLHFHDDFHRRSALLAEQDWRLLPPPIARAILPVTASVSCAGRLRACV
jgi:hypothetical protein